MDRRKMLLSLFAASGLELLNMESTEGQEQRSMPSGRLARKPVIPQQVIDEFKLRPAEGYGLWVMGEDGKPYSLDDVLAVIFVLLRAHWGGDQRKK